MTSFMKCGHQSNSTTAQGKPACAICIGITPNAEIEGDVPDLTGRVAICSYCSKTETSRVTLPFWEYGAMIRGKKHLNMDSYYCGCRGWD